MARVYEYKRSVDAVITEGDLEKFQFKLGGESLIHIKQEPCNTNNEDTCTTDNGGNTKYMQNKSENDQTICDLTEKKSKDNVPDNMSASTRDNKSNVSCLNEKRKSRKRKRHDIYYLGDKNDCENMKALEESDGNFKSYKRPKRAVTKKNKQRTVQCKICLLKFNSYLALHLHNKSYERKQSLLVRVASFGRGRYVCNLCSKTFKIKRPLQAHLFHLHQSELGIDVEKDSLSNELSNSYFRTPKKQIMRQTTLFEYMTPPVQSEYSEITNKLNDSNVYPHAIIKQEIDISDNDLDLSMNMSSVDISPQNKIPSQPTSPNQPFVKIHVHSSTMKVLLGINSNDSSEPSKNNSKDNNSDELYASGSSNDSKKLNNEEPFVVYTTEPVDIGEKLKNDDLLSKCKKCSVILVRCDDKSITKLTSQFNTPSTQILGQNNCISLKRKRQQSRDLDAIITQIFDTPRSAISKGSSSTNSTPKSFLSSSTSTSQVTIHDFHVINNLRKQLASRRSSHEQIAPDVEKTISNEKTNALDPKDISSQEESDCTSTQPTVNFKIKEVRVSLIKLPEFKKELDTSTIFYCEICELPFSSEKRKDKHIRKLHTTYISSICMARYNLKRQMLKHYLEEHCIWGCNKCCVCRRFFRNRFLLQHHLLLHCIKVILPKDDNHLNTITKCNVRSKIHRRTTSLPYSIKCKEIADIEQKNVNPNSVDNIESQIDTHKANKQAEAKMRNYEQQAFKINKVNHEMQNSFENNVIYLSVNSDYETTMELPKEPILDPLNIINDSLINNNETLITLTPNINTVAPSISNDNKSVSILSNITENTKNRYPCSICGKQFKKLENLWQHKRTYTQSSKYFCATCGLCFSNRKMLRRHINSTHEFYSSNLYKYHCQFCNQGFRTDTNLRIHELHYHATVETTGKQKVAELLQVSNAEKNLNTPETMCNVCGRNFNSYERYQLHCMYYHKGHIFACNFCDQIFQGLYMLHHHNKLQHYPESTRLSYTYHCPICYEGFTIETHFHGHMAHVHPNKQHVASLNDASTSTKKSYICSKCHLEFPTIIELMVHIEHYTDGGNYECQQCHRKCCTLAVLNEHINLSHGENFQNNYRCNICNEVLISNTSLLCHKKHVHQCLDNCEDFAIPNSTSNETVGEIESNIHDKVLPVIAGSENELVSSFNPLIRTNTSVSPAKVWAKCNISCSICGIKFDTELYLKKHLIEYLDVGDYKCNKCQRCFANCEILEKHMANHTKPGMPLTKYYCSVCDENFQSSIVYESHVAHLHANIVFMKASSSNVLNS